MDPWSRGAEVARGILRSSPSGEDSESRRFELNISQCVSQEDVDPASSQELFLFGGVSKFRFIFVKIRAHSERCRNIKAGIFEIQHIFFGTSRLH